MGKSKKISSIVLYVLMIVSIALFLYMFFSIDDQKNPGEKARMLMTVNVDWTIAMFFLATALTLVFALTQMFSTKTKALRGLSVLLIFAVVVGISYFVSSSEIPQFFGVEKFVADGTITPNIVRWIGAGLDTTYILAVAAILSIVGFGAYRTVKH